MHCRKCETIRTKPDGTTYVVQGRVFVDRIFSEKSHIELVCIACGHRWMLNKTKNVFAAWLVKVEEAYLNSVTLAPTR